MLSLRKVNNMRFLLMFTLTATCFTSSIFAQATIQPVPPRPVNPIVRPPSGGYPGYGYPGYGYGHRSGPIEPTYISAKEQREQKKKDFEAENAKRNSMTGQTKKTINKKPVEQIEKNQKLKESRTERYNARKNAPLPTGVRDSSKGPNVRSFGHANISKILTEQIGTPYSSTGETPEDGFSPVGLIKYVARKLGVKPKFNTPTEAWDNAGLFLKAPYGQFETGDLLFFKLYSKSTQKGELFLALALDEKYMVYPSFSRKKVVKRSFLDDFWKKHFKGAKRIPSQMR